MTPVDDAGRSFKPVSLAELGRDPRMADPRFRLMLERTVRAQLMNTPHLWIVFASLAFLLPIVIVGAALLLRGIFPMLVLILIPMLVMIGFGLASRRYIRAKSRTQVVAVLIRHGICPGCGYDLPPSGGEPLVRCPECSCAWRAERVHSRHNGSGYAWGDKPTTAESIRRFRSHMDLFGPKRAVDARGRWVPLASSRLRRQLEATTDEDHRRRLVLAQDAMSRHGIVLRMTAAVVVTAFAVLNLATRVFPDPATYAHIASAAFMCVFFGCLARWILRSSLGVTRDALKSTLLTNHLCPTCAADLASLSDGERSELMEPIECPDCGAAWNPHQSATSRPPVA
jgi:uncharacterized C2H2 Zn-finger protein